MAEPAEQMAGVSVNIRAPLDALDRDLTKARNTLNAFDRSIGTKNLDELAKAGNRADDSIEKLVQQLLLAARAQNEFAAANDNAIATQSQHQGVLRKTYETYKQIDDAVTGVKLTVGAGKFLAPFAAQLPIVQKAAAAAGVAIESMNPALAGVVSSVASKFMPALALVSRIAIPFTLVTSTIRAMNAVTELGTQKMEELSQVMKKAQDTGFSPDFFLRMGEASRQLKVSFEEVTEMMTKFSSVTKEGPGGALSTFDAKLKELRENGNAVNPFLELAYKNARGVEEKYAAGVDLVNDLLGKGKEIAALDLAATFMPPALVERLRNNNDFLSKTLSTAEKISATKLATEADVKKAADLKERLAESERILSEKWLPIQRDLTQLGLNYKQSWVEINETLAVGVGWLTQFYETLKKTPDKFAEIGNSDFFKWLQQRTAGGEAPSFILGPQDDALEKLKAGLASSSEIAKAGAATQAVYNQVWKDSSNALKTYNEELAKLRGLASSEFEEETKIANLRKAKEAYEGARRAIMLNTKPGESPDAALLKALERDYNLVVAKLNEKVDEAAAAFDRAKDSVTKHTAIMLANKDSVGKGAAAQEYLRVQALLTDAVLSKGGNVDDYRERIDKLATAAGNAAREFAKAKVAADTAFQKQTWSMSSEDQQIAGQLRGIYGEDVQEALASKEAADLRQIRRNREMKDTAVEFTTNLVQGLMAGKSAMKALGDAAAGLADKLAQSAIQDLFSGNLVGAGIKGVAAAGAFLFSSQQKKKEQQQQAFWAAVQRSSDFAMQTQLAAIDTSTRAGALAAQTINQQRELAQEMHAGGQARYALEAKHRLELSNLNREWDQRELKEAQQKREQLNALIRGYTDRFYGVVTDTSTLEGALKEHDRKAARERLDAVDQSAEAMAYLELTLGVERLAIQKRFVDAAVEEERRLAKERIDASNSAVSGIANWLRGMVTGTTAGYSPQTRLQAAAATYDAMIAQARTGSLEAANQLTTAADALLDAARGFYGSSQGYQQIRSLIISDISHLGPVVTSTDPVVQAVLNVVDAVQSSTNAINTVNTSVGGVNTSVGGVNTSVGAVNTATGLVKSTLIDTNSAIGTTNTKIGDDTTNTKNIAGRQEAEYFNSTEESTGLAAERAKQQVDLGNQQVSIQNKMLDALNEIIRLDGVIAKTGATAIVAPTTTTVDPTLEATKAANRKRYNDDVALRNAWLNGTPGTYFYNYALSWVINPANYQPMASGGRVSGPGGPVDDLVHTRLSNTEGVLPGAAMKRLDDTYGRSVFDNFLMQGRLPSIPAVSTAGNDNILMAGFLALGRKVDQLSDGLDRVVRATAVGSMHVREGVDNMATATTVLVQEQKLARAS